jgi:GNAT superfamily N-acetyltransferase
MKPEIIKATVEDIKMVVPLFDAYRVFYNQLSDIEGAEKFLQDRVSRKESIIFIAVLNGRGVGFTQLYPIFSSVSLKPALLLNDLFVVEEAREQGVAEALLNRAKEYGRQIDAKWMLLETAPDNYNAQSLYVKNGWIKQTDIFYQFSIGV